MQRVALQVSHRWNYLPFQHCGVKTLTKIVLTFYGEQDVWCGRPEVREKEVDPLFRGCDLHHLLRSSQCIRHGACRGRRSGESGQLLCDDEALKIQRGIDSVFISDLFRTACTSPSIYSTVSAITDSLHWLPSCFSSTRRISLRREDQESPSEYLLPRLWW